MNPKIGDTIKAFGQQEKIIDIDGEICYLAHPIVVKGILYTRDYVFKKEIQEII